jgi:phosphoglycolate phosphatase-like HAD superfamily hydrolase
MTSPAAGPVIWDVDGTLAATTELGFSATNVTLHQFGLREITRAEYQVY